MKPIDKIVNEAMSGITPANAAIEQQEATSLELAVKSLRQSWRSYCPKEFHTCDRAKLSNPAKLDEALDWKYGPNGLVLYGPTGKGKTRIAWIILEREFMRGRRVAFLDSMAGIHYASKFSESGRAVECWLMGKIKADILLMDDVFKNKLTDSFENVIFTVIDQRIQRQLPIIITSNDTGKSLATRMTGDRSQPLLRRLREHCSIIQF